MATEIERIENLEGKYSDLHTVVNVLAANVNNLSDEMTNEFSLDETELDTFIIPKNMGNPILGKKMR